MTNPYALPGLTHATRVNSSLTLVAWKAFAWRVGLGLGIFGIAKRVVVPLSVSFILVCSVSYISIIPDGLGIVHFVAFLAWWEVWPIVPISSKTWVRYDPATPPPYGVRIVIEVSRCWRCFSTTVVLMAAGLLVGQACALEPKEVFKKASPSVVFIQNTLAAGGAISGSGVVISPDTVATNCHVVDGASALRVVSRGAETAASIYRRDPQHDICLVRTRLPGAPQASIADPASVTPGSRVYAIGAPLGLDLTLTEGLVSAIRTVDAGTVIQTSAAISHGSSGGGLFDDKGLLVGFTTFSLKDSQSLNFAVPVSVALALLARKDPDPMQGDGALRNAVLSAVKAATIKAAPPLPAFDTITERIAYLRWLGATSQKLKSREQNGLARDEFLQALWYESTRAGLDPALVLGVVEATSNFQRWSVTDNGARGYMHVATSWAAKIGNGDTAALFHMQTNLRFGCVLIRHYIDQNQGDLYLALIDYYGQMMNRTVAASDPGAAIFPNAVLKAQRHWVYREQ